MISALHRREILKALDELEKFILENKDFARQGGRIENWNRDWDFLNSARQLIDKANKDEIQKLLDVDFRGLSHYFATYSNNVRTEVLLGHLYHALKDSIIPNTKPSSTQICLQGEFDRIMNSKQRIEGDILWLKCVDCSLEFPVFVFAGDSDLATDELRTSTDVVSKTLFIYMRSGAFPGGRKVELAEIEAQRPILDGNFQEFLNRQKGRPPRCLYKCVGCNSGKAPVVKKLSGQELVANGYSLIQKI